MARSRSKTPPVAVTPELLLRAYSIGVFPMAESADDPTLFWVDPPERGIFPLDGIIVSHKLARTIRADRFTVKVDHDFAGVIAGCAAAAPDRPSTWISGRIRDLYGQLFHMGFVHTVETYDEAGALATTATTRARRTARVARCLTSRGPGCSSGAASGVARLNRRHPPKRR